MRLIKSITFLSLIALLLGSCNSALVPENSAYENPSILEQGKIEAALSYTRNSISLNVLDAQITNELNASIDNINNNRFGAAVNYGVTDNLNIGVGYKYVTSNEFKTKNNDIPGHFVLQKSAASVIQLNPKYVFIEDKLAFSAPLEIYLHKDDFEYYVLHNLQDQASPKSTTFAVRPTVSFGYPVSDAFKPYMNVTANYAFGKDKILSNHKEFNLGFNLGAELALFKAQPIILHPAAGLQFPLEERYKNPPGSKERQPLALNYGLKIGYRFNQNTSPLIPKP